MYSRSIGKKIILNNLANATKCDNRMESRRMLKNGKYHAKINQKLTAIVGDENITSKEIDRTIYSVGRNWLARTWLAQGRQIPKIDFIVQPETEDEISAILLLANKERIPIVPFGGLSSAMGGTLPVHGGIFVDIKKLDKLIEVNDNSLMVKTQTGINCWKLEDELNKCEGNR